MNHLPYLAWPRVSGAGDLSSESKTRWPGTTCWSLVTTGRYASICTRLLTVSHGLNRPVPGPPRGPDGAPTSLRGALGTARATPSLPTSGMGCDEVPVSRDFTNP